MRRMGDDVCSGSCGWSDYIGDNRGGGLGVERVGTSPVDSAMWGEVRTPVRDPTTMVFRRFPRLTCDYDELDTLTKTFLGIIEPVGYKFADSQKICSDAWVVNLKTGGCMEEQRMVGVDVSDELKDLFRVYVDSEKHLLRQEKNVLESLVMYMKSFIEKHEERKKVSGKLQNLKNKLIAGQPCEECDEDEGDDE